MRKYFIAAMAVTALAAFAIPGTAFAVSPNVASLDAKFNPTNPGNVSTKGGLFVETSTLINAAGPGTPTTPAKEPVPTTQVDLDFDHALTFATGSVPACTGALTGTTQQGMRNCVNSVIGGGYATLCISSTGPGGACDTGGYPAPTTPAAPGVVNAQVTAYDGPSTCGTGSQACIYLQAVSDHTPLGPTTQVLTGTLRNSPLGGDYQLRLTVPVPVIGGGAAAITDFSVGINNNVYIRNKCDDGSWSYSAKFTYLSGTPDTVTAPQPCT
jgi:hypothetical protein